MNAEDLAARLATSRKYRHVCAETLARVAAWAAARHRKPADAEKAAKTKLHQVFAAFVDEGDLARFAALAAALPDHLDDPKAQLRPLLECHTSTGERLSTIDAFHDAIRAEVGSPMSILDLGCGFNALALPWWGDPSTIEYVGWDLDARVAETLNGVLARFAPRARVEALDILAATELPAADVVLLYKLLPTLDRQEHEASVQLLRRLRCRAAIVTYPSKSLCGRGKGMEGNYREMAVATASAAHWRAQELAIEGELVFVMRPETSA